MEATKEMSINASPATIFPYLVDPEKLVQWMGTEVLSDPVPHGEFRVLCGGVNPGAGEFVEVKPNEKVIFHVRLGRAGASDPRGLDGS